MSELARSRRVERAQSWYLDLGMIADYAATGGSARKYHHTAPISMIFALHAGLGAVLDEGLEAALARHAECGRPDPARARQARLRTARRRRPSAAAADDGAAARERRRRVRPRAHCSSATGSRSAAASVRGPAPHGASGAWGTRRACAMSRPSSRRSKRSSGGDPRRARPNSTGRRVVLRPLTSGDFEGWRDVRRRCRDWLLKWEPRPSAGHPDPTEDRQAFAARCGARERERQMGSGFGFGIFVDRKLAGEINLSSIQRGPFQNAYVGYWIDRGRGRSGVHARGRRARVAVRVRGAEPAPRADLDHPAQPSPAAASSRSSACATKAWPSATSRSTASGRTTCVTP